MALLSYLETVQIDNDKSAAFRMPVQYVIRPNQDFRGYAGRIASGSLECGQQIKILPSGKRHGSIASWLVLMMKTMLLLGSRSPSLLMVNSISHVVI